MSTSTDKKIEMLLEDWVKKALIPAGLAGAGHLISHDLLDDSFNDSMDELETTQPIQSLLMQAKMGGREGMIDEFYAKHPQINYGGAGLGAGLGLGGLGAKALYDKFKARNREQADVARAIPVG